MKRITKLLKKALKFVAPIFLFSVSLGSVVVSVASAVVLNVEEEQFFIATEGGHTYKCYEIEGNNSNAHNVAIAWSISPENPYPSTLTIPEHVTHPDSGVSYTVKCIAKAGFRYCTSTEINLPDSIEDIKEEAFAYCQEITKFVLPEAVTEIAPSTFLDCRKLHDFMYKRGGQEVLGNHVVTKIGDHAFDSCVSLTNINCPTTVRVFGKSCFQKCENLQSFFFPAKNNDDEPSVAPTNTITVESYAFAECKSLRRVYFEENMQTIQKYAFAGSNLDLTFECPCPDNRTPEFAAHWRDKFITTSNSEVFGFIDDAEYIREDDEYPGLFYSIKSGSFKLSCGSDQTGVSFNNAESDPEYDEDEDYRYVCIDRFEAPKNTQTGYYNASTGALTIPNRLKQLKVKQIGAGAFRDHTELTSVTFNEDLIQIQGKAFAGSNLISNLDFSHCNKLKEIGHDAFGEPKKKSDEEVYNNVCHNIELPACLEYLGEFSFYNFTSLTGCIEFTCDENKPNIKVIGAYAFAINRGVETSYSAVTTGINLVLPCSLDDAAARNAKYTHPNHGLDGVTNGRFMAIEYKSGREPAVGTHAFDCCYTIITAKMEECDGTGDHNGHTHTISLASNVFVRAKSMVWFKANQRLLFVGDNCFKYCDSLRELYLTSENAEALNESTYPYPWGIADANNNYKQGLFCDSDYARTRDIVIYVTGPKAPNKNDNTDSTTGNVYLWNAISEKNKSYDNKLAYDAVYSKRSKIPTFYGIDWFGDDDIVHWNPKASGDAAFVTNLNTKAQFDAGVIAFAKDSSDNYTVARYYTSAGNAKTDIDLTSVKNTSESINVSAHLTTIGDEAFGTDDDGIAPGTNFILPHTVTTIRERAFFRSGSSKGVKKITYKPDGSDNAVVPEGDLSGYCVLPSGVSRIERDAFYNNQFEVVHIPSSLSFLGNAAFLSYADGTNKNTGFAGSFATGSVFSNTNNGIYYSDENVKFLLSQANGVSGTLTIDSGTDAIGMYACARTKYTKITLPDGLKTIYSGGFQQNKDLITVDGAGLEDLEYISAFASSSEEVYNMATHKNYFDNYDYSNRTNNDSFHKDNVAIKRSRSQAFQGCTSLTTLNFRSMTNLKKIGVAAFKDCSALQYMTDKVGAETTAPVYNFYTTIHTGGDTSSNVPIGGSTSFDTLTTVTNGVLDLSRCTKITSIMNAAFKGCNNMDYTFLPDTTGEVRNDAGKRNAHSKMRIANDSSSGNDPTAEGASGTPFNGQSSDKIFVGETIHQAWINQNNTTCDVGTYYPKGCFGSNTVYYYAKYKTDVYTGQNTGVNYWTKDVVKIDGVNTEVVVMFTTAAAAYDYLPDYTTPANP